MKVPEFHDFDPRTLRLPSSRVAGADPAKLHRQIARYGNSMQGMPPIFEFRATDGEFVIADGVTRAKRVAKLIPNQPVCVEVIGDYPSPGSRLPTVGDRLP
jgi:hypothetical protein